MVSGLAPPRPRRHSATRDDAEETRRRLSLARSNGAILVGLISDTHGLVRPEALAALAVADLLLHAGDVGGDHVLDALSRIAPVFAVRGNNDRGPWARALPAILRLGIAGVSIEVVHDVHEVDEAAVAGPPGSGPRVLVTGHSHLPAIAWRRGALHVNPGAAGPRRFRLPVSVGLLRLSRGGASAAIVPLDVGPAASRSRRLLGREGDLAR